MFPLNVLLDRLARFSTDRRGQFALLTAIVLPVVVMTAGLATDFSLQMRGAKHLQDLLDTAVLAGAAEAGGKDQKLLAAQQMFDSLPTEAAFNSKPVATFEFEGDYIIKGKAVAQTPLMLLGAFFKGPLETGVESAASMKVQVQSVRFSATNAQGWWEKKVKLMVVRPGSVTPEEVARVHYQVSKATPPPRGTMSATPSGWASLGQYTKAYLQFEIGPTAFEFNKWCAGCPTLLRSDDPNTSDRFVIDGVKVAKGTVLDIFDFAPCGKKSIQSWEDGGGGAPDIHYTVDVQCGASSGYENTRLLK